MQARSSAERLGLGLVDFVTPRRETESDQEAFQLWTVGRQMQTRAGRGTGVISRKRLDAWAHRPTCCRHLA